MKPVTEELLRQMPKVEFHVHLEALLPAERLAALAEEAGVPLPRPVDQLFGLTDLSAFLDFLKWSVSLLRTREQLEEAAFYYARFAAESGITYAEVIINPTHWPHWPLPDLIAGLAAGFEQAEAAGHTPCYLLLSLLRQQTQEDAMRLVHYMEHHRPPRVVGLSIDGNEAATGRTGKRFAPAFDAAAKAGFGKTVHAGESSGPEGVLDALDDLKADRIDHGVRAAEDPTVMARLAQEQVPINVCITSNLRYHLYPSAESHPLAILDQAGVPLTIHTDHPAYMGVDLAHEYALAARLAHWGWPEILRSAHTSIDATFAAPERKAALHRELLTFASGLE